MTKDEFLDMAKKYKYFEIDYDILLNALNEYTSEIKECYKQYDPAVNDFVDKVDRMRKLYSDNRYGLAEELKDKLAEQLDDIMRIKY